MKWIAVPALMLGSACSAAPPLPPAPPPRAPSELAAWREPPPLAPDQELRLSWVTRREVLPSGLGITVISRPETRITAIELWVPSARDTGHGAITALGEGLRAGTRTPKGVLVNARLAQREIQVRTNPSGTVFAWQVLPRASELALDLLADFVVHPVFEARETLQRLHQELAAIQRYSGSFAHVADIARAAIPGIDIDNPERSARDLIELDARRLLELHRCAMSPVGAELVVAGPVDAERALGWARAAFGDFSAAQDCAPGAAVASASSPQDFRLERPALQIIYGSVSDPLVMMAIPGPALGSEDYLPFALLAQVIERRETGSARQLRHMGATYGIHSRLNEAFPRLTLLELSGQVDPASARSALRTLIEDLRGLSSTLTEPELEQVKRRWRNAHADAMSDNAALAGAAIWHLRRGRSPDAVADWPGELGAVSLERCREVAERWLAPAQPSIAVSGLPVRLVRGLGLGVEVHELYWTDKLQEHRKSL